MDKQGTAMLDKSNGAGPTLERGQGLTRERGTMRQERMPFTIRLADSEAALDKAVQIRQAAYERHLPELASRLGAPESTDREAGTVVLLAESKFDGSPLGTMRIQTNRFRPLGVQQSVPLPASLSNSTLAEATRLGVTGGIRGSVVKTMLFKAFYLYCVQEHVEKMVIVARSPLDKQYEALLFEDVFDDKPFLAMSHVGNIPHRVMVFDVPSALVRWQAANHPLCDFIFFTEHPDLNLRQPRPIWAPQPIGGRELDPELHVGATRPRIS